MDLDLIMGQWQKDCIIDPYKLDDTSRHTPMLHAKYLHLLSKAKLRHRSFQLDQKKLLLQKWKYYNGKMCEDEIKATGWDLDPFNGIKVLKGEMDLYYDSDPEIQQSEETIAYYKMMIDTLTDIVDSLKWRHQTIGNMIKWKQFEAGG
jgi:hypothetical protein